MKRLLLTLAAVATCASAALVYAKLDGEERFFRDIRPAHWSWNGADLETIERVFERLRAAEGRRVPAGYVDTLEAFGPGNWTYEFEALGDRFMTRAEQEDQKGLSGSASFYYNKAASYYALAKYPHKRGAVHQTRAYQKNIEAVGKAWRAAGMPFEHIRLRFEEQPVDGLLHLPAGTPPRGGWPLVLAMNGLDVFKGEFFSLPYLLADRGIAFFALDLMGTGTHAAFRLVPENDRLVSFFMDQLSAHDDIDGRALGFMGVSFAGNTAARLAFTEEVRLRAVVNMCGPVHSVFMSDEEDIADILPMYVEGFRDRSHLEEATDTELVAHLGGFSLLLQGLVGEGRTPSTVPLLSINARNDPVVPAFDMELAAAASVDGQVIYSGTNDHCPQDRFAVMPEVTRFLRQHLVGPSQMN